MQTVVQGAALLMDEQPWLRKDNLDLALFHYVDLRNHMPNSHSPRFQGRSPHHIMTGLPCDLQREYKFQFGDLVACNIPKDLKDFKFDTRNQLAIYVGEEENIKGGHVIYWPYTKSTTVRDDCVKLHISDAQFLHYYSKLINAKVKTLPYLVVEQALRDFEEVSYDFIIDNITPVIAEADPDELANLSKSLSVCLFDSISYDTSSISTPTVSPSTELYHKYLHVYTSSISTPNATELNYRYPRSHTPSISTPISVKPTDLSFTHSHRRVRFSDPIEDDTYENTMVSSWRNLTSIRPPSEPPPLSQSETDAAIDHFMLAHCHPAFSTNKTTVTKALKGPQLQEWLKAIRDEVNLLFTRGTLEPVPRHLVPATGRKIIHSTMQLKHKTFQTGESDKYKGRLCACGNELWSSTAETCSPTIGALPYAPVHQLAIIDDLFTCTVDTVGAYLYQEYPDDAPPIYLVLPPNVAEACELDPTMHYRIRRYLYGLPDSGRAYYKAYSAHLISHGYMRTTADPCLFVKVTNGNRTYIFTPVDDTFCCSTDASELLLFQSVMREKYEITVNDSIDEYLGIGMEHMPNGDVKLTQPKLLQSMFDEFANDIDFMKNTLSPQHLPHLQNPDPTPIDQSKYLYLLGALIYVTKSRPDIATAVSFAAVHAAHPTAGAYAELLLCLKYLYQTRHMGLILQSGEKNRNLTLTCYVDASYLTHNDSKSHTGFTLSLGTIGTFLSKSSKQTMIATSSTHAEMRAMYSAIIDIISLSNCLKNFRDRSFSPQSL